MFKTLSTMTLLGLLTLSAALAQSEQPIRAKVPLAFTVQNTRLPAGNYQLSTALLPTSSRSKVWTRAQKAHSPPQSQPPLLPRPRTDRANWSLIAMARPAIWGRCGRAGLAVIEV